MLTFHSADLRRVPDLDTLTRFNIAYLNWIAENVQAHFGLAVTDLINSSIPDYVTAALDKLCESAPPEGVFYIVFDSDRAVGMGGLRRVREGVGEIKRIYVAPDVRGAGAGAKILARLIEDGRAFGYPELVLETGPFMQSAHRLYEAAGFVDCAPYPEAEVPAPLYHGWRFMRKTFG
jgi:GNAT superfamily N-acetyltransferase